MKILNFGSCNVDYVYSLDHIVKIGETETTNGFKIFPGGKGLNQSIALARAGAKVYHAGCIGSNGEVLIDTLKKCNVDISLMKYVAEENGHAIIQVTNKGDNSIFLFPGSNEMITTEYVDEVLTHFEKGDIILLQNEINNLDYIVSQAYEKGMQIIFNPSPYNEKINKIDFNMLSYIVLNEIEASDLSGFNEPEDALIYLRNKYPNLKIMLTLGSKGCIYQDSEKRNFHPIFKVKVVDTTAAGDTFTGYFVAGISERKTIDIILEQASCASAISVSRNGASPSIPYMNEVISNIDSMKKEELPNEKEPVYMNIDRYITKNISSATLKELGEILGYSTVYTGTVVKKVTGKPFSKLLQEKRLEKAQELLLKTDFPIGLIIKKVGYENESFFRKLFKAKYGVNPTKYRKC